MKIYHLRVDDQKNPCGIDSTQPIFSWNVQTETKNWKQENFRIIVSDQREQLEKNVGNVWDSRECDSQEHHSWKVPSSSMVQISYAGKALKSSTYYYWKVLILPRGENEWIESEIASFETAFFHAAEWKGAWIGEKENFQIHMFRKTFKAEKKIEKARLYICGLGHYEAFINGRRVGDRVLEPGWTNYNKTCLYSVYDITSQVKKGENGIGIFLGDGMYNVVKKRYVYYERSFGKMKFLAQLRLTFEDGTNQIIVTDDSWKMASGPLTYSNLYGGEDYDARLEQDGFSCGDFIENNTWMPVSIVAPPKGKLVVQSTPALKVMEEYKAIQITKLGDGSYVYDFGKNFSGWVSMKLSLPKEGLEGSKINLYPAELIKEDGQPDQWITGNNYCWNYICNDKRKQEYTPKFTYTGFRYVKVTGAIPTGESNENSLPLIEALTGEFIYPDMEKVGSFSCSNELFNQIHQIVNQAMKSNIKSIFTDCPHREKLGWMEETHLIGPAMMYNYDLRNLYKKTELDMKEAQRENGLIPDICPEYVTGFEQWHTGYVDSPEWGSASIINAWYVYRKYGDFSIVEQYYETMKKYLSYLTSKTHHYMLHHGLGDWLDIGPNPPFSQNTPVSVIASSIYYYDIKIMHWAATKLGKVEDAKEYESLMKKVKEEFNLQYYDGQTGRYATGSQAAQAMSLVTGLVEEENRQKVFDHLVKDIINRGYATTAGDVGHPFVLAALTMYGRSDIINEMTNITDKPGYGYQVTCGATTLTESWDGPNPDHPHDSQNHLMLGSIEEWFYAGLGGIQLVRNENPLDEIEIRPHFAKGIDYVQVTHRHPYGELSVHWRRIGDKEIEVNLVIPANTTAKFYSELDGSIRDLSNGRWQLILKQLEK